MEWNNLLAERGEVVKPQHGQIVLVKMEEVYNYMGKDYRMGPVYFVAEYYNGQWYAWKEHLEVSAGWDGGEIDDAFKTIDLTAWTEITE